MPERGSKTSTARRQSSEQLLEFFFSAGAIQMISCRDWWPWMKPGYITMTRRQSNNQWSGGIAAHLAPKIPSAKMRWNSSRLDFLGIKTASSSLIVFQRAKLSTCSITHFCRCNSRTFWRKNASEVQQWGLVARQYPGSSGTCNPEENGQPGLPMFWSPTLFSGSGPVGLLPVPWTEKAIERSPFYFRRGGHSCRGYLVGRTNFWTFLEWLVKVRATG